MNRRDHPAFEKGRTLGISPAVGKSPNEAWRNGLEALKLNHEKLIKETSARRDQDRKKWAEMDSKRKKVEVRMTQETSKRQGDPLSGKNIVKSGPWGSRNSDPDPEPRLSFLD